MLTTIGERLKYVRTTRRRTQKEMAKLFDVSLSMYQKYESNKSNLSPSSIIKLMQEYEISSDWLLTGTTSHLHADITLGLYFGGIRTISDSSENIYKRICYIIELEKNSNTTKDIVDKTIKTIDKLTHDERKNIFYEKATICETEHVKVRHKYDTSIKHPYSNLPITAFLDFSLTEQISLEWLLYGTINKKNIETKTILLEYRGNQLYQDTGVTY